MNRFFIFVLALLPCAPLSAQTTRPVPGIDRVLIISVDGLRPDVLLRANTPNMHSLFLNGSFTFWAKTTAQSITLPSHVSMLTGVVPEVHSILWNSDLPFSEPVYPAAPTLFELAHKAGLTTAMIAGKAKFVVFDKPGVLDWKYLAKASRPPTSRPDGTFDPPPPPEPRADAIVTEHAVQILRDHKPEVMFVHLAGVDNFGHSYGWGSAPQLEAAAEADRCIGLILAALSDSGLTKSTLIIVTADHGGSGRTHGPEDPPSRAIPWIISGPHVRPNFDLTLIGHQREIQTFDTFATACAVLGLHPPIDDPVIGRFVEEAFDTGNLLVDKYEPKMVPATEPATEPTTAP
jgi:predicted AlkP superfamily pyrophosphatase or phosphodiesterase